MRRTFHICLCALLLMPALLFGYQSSQTALALARASAGSLADDAAEIAKIEAYVRQLDRSMKQTRGRYFADVASEQDQNPRWQEFKTKREFQKSEAYTTATVWVKPAGEITVADMYLSSPSGDWSMYNTYYYRADGTLARMRSELRTFMGDVIVIRDRLYASNGKALREKTSYLDLKTRKPKPIKEGDYQDMPLEVYAKAASLPFYNLVKK